MTATPYGLSGRRGESVGTALGASLLFHAVLLGVFVVLSLIEPPKLDLNKNPVNAKLVRLGQERDPRFLPRKDVTAPPPPKSREAPRPVPKPATPQPPRAVSIFDKLNQPTSIFDRVQKQPQTIFDQVEGSPQGSPEGDSSQAEGEQYYALLEVRIRRYFRVGGVPESELTRLSAILEIRLDARGEVIHVEVAKSSDNPVYDAEVISAVKRAAPFGAPPEHLKKEVASGVSIEFRFKKR